MKKLLVLLIACLALTLAACGDDDDDDGGSSGGEATTTEQTDTGTPPAGETGGSVDVDIPAIEFDPKNVTVKVGTSVNWTNSDDLPHTVTKIDGPGAPFDSGNLDPDGTFEHTFDEPGKVNYVCTVHPGQEGSVTVE